MSIGAWILDVHFSSSSSGVFKYVSCCKKCCLCVITKCRQLQTFLLEMLIIFLKQHSSWNTLSCPHSKFSVLLIIFWYQIVWYVTLPSTFSENNLSQKILIVGIKPTFKFSKNIKGMEIEEIQFKITKLGPTIRLSKLLYSSKIYYEYTMDGGICCFGIVNNYCSNKSQFSLFSTVIYFSKNCDVNLSRKRIFFKLHQKLEKCNNWHFIHFIKYQSVTINFQLYIYSLKIVRFVPKCSSKFLLK